MISSCSFLISILCRIKVRFYIFQNPIYQKPFKTFTNFSTYSDSAKCWRNLYLGLPQKKRKTRSQSLVSSPIPQLDGNNKHASSESEIEPDPEPETQPNPNPGDSDEYETESEPSPVSKFDPLPPSNMDNPMFGYCEDKKCRLCPVKSTEKVGNYYSCFTNSSIKCCCQAIHWHSKTKICLTYNDIQNL